MSAEVTMSGTVKEVTALVGDCRREAQRLKDPDMYDFASDGGIVALEADSVRGRLPRRPALLRPMSLAITKEARGSNQARSRQSRLVRREK